jgi:hypothetical protein
MSICSRISAEVVSFGTIGTPTVSFVQNTMARACTGFVSSVVWWKSEEAVACLPES